MLKHFQGPEILVIKGEFNKLQIISMWFSYPTHKPFRLNRFGGCGITNIAAFSSTAPLEFETWFNIDQLLML